MEQDKIASFTMGRLVEVLNYVKRNSAMGGECRINIQFGVNGKPLFNHYATNNGTYTTVNSLNDYDMLCNALGKYGTFVVYDFFNLPVIGVWLDPWTGAVIIAVQKPYIPYSPKH